MENLDPVVTQDLVKLFFIFVGVIFIGTIIAGATNKVVIFFNWSDLINTIMMFICPLVIGGGGMAIFQNENGEINETTGIIILVFTAITTLYFIVKNFILSIKYNKSLIIGLFIGVMKMVVAILGVLIVIGYIGELTDKEYKTIGQWILLGLIFGFFIWLAKKLVNGQSVYATKGWQVIN